VNRNTAQLKDTLERLYAKYSHRELVPPDPLQFVYRYSEAGDMEIAALLSAVLAYGRVEQIEKSLNNLFGRMGKSPYEFVKTFSETSRQGLGGFKHRFTTGDDINDLLRLLKGALEKSGSIERYFLLGYGEHDENIIPALSGFCDSLLKAYEAESGRPPGRGLKYLLAGPTGGSPCKRLNLFLRWMVRDDEVDLGLWKFIDKAKLIVPMDVHMSRISRVLGFHGRKNISIKTAIKVTESFAEIEPDDPVKYDFALSRIGITENCTGKVGNRCEGCELVGYCLRARGRPDAL
jgi:uncharacterized protein (TIGR02757 family)